MDKLKTNAPAGWRYPPEFATTKHVKFRRTKKGSRYPGFCPSRLVKLGGNHYSKRPTWSRRRAPMDRFGLAPCGVCHAALVTLRAVRSYRTFSPLPLRAVYFLWHFPWKSPRFFKRHTALWSPEVPPPAPKSAGSGYLAATDIILNSTAQKSRLVERPYVVDNLKYLFQGNGQSRFINFLGTVRIDFFI